MELFTVQSDRSSLLPVADPKDRTRHAHQRTVAFFGDAQDRGIPLAVSISLLKATPVDVYLETERLLLRRFTSADVDLLVELDSDPAVMHFITGGLPHSRAEIEREELPAFLGYYERYHGLGFWAAVERESGTFVGWFHLRPEQGDPMHVELGYRLRASAWGKGYATEGSRGLIKKGFTEMGVQRVVAYTMAVHVASRRVMEKAGLRYIRTFHADWPYPIPGDEHGDVETRWRDMSGKAPSLNECWRGRRYVSVAA